AHQPAIADVAAQLPFPHRGERRLGEGPAELGRRQGVRPLERLVDVVVLERNSRDRGRQRVNWRGHALPPFLPAAIIIACRESAYEERAQMLTDYIRAAMRHATYEWLDEGGIWYGEIPQLPGVWASAATEAEAPAELQSALEVWIAIRLANGRAIPAIDGITIAYELAG